MNKIEIAAHMAVIIFNLCMSSTFLVGLFLTIFPKNKLLCGIFYGMSAMTLMIIIFMGFFLADPYLFSFE